MSVVLAGALCVFAALSAGPSMRASHAWLKAGVVVAAAACGAIGGPGAVALVLAVVAGFIGYRFGRGAAGASAQTLFATIAFVAWMLPDPDSAFAVLAGGSVAALGCVIRMRASRESTSLRSMHLACAGACAALAYVVGAQSGAPAVVSVIAMLALIGAHLSLAMGGSTAAPLACAMSAAAACGLALAAAIGGSHGALFVAAVVIAVGCTRSATLVGIVRETP
jgi:hypothetical protein